MDSSKTVWMIFLEIHEFKPRKIPFSAMNVYVFHFVSCRVKRILIFVSNKFVNTGNHYEKGR